VTECSRCRDATAGRPGCRGRLGPGKETCAEVWAGQAGCADGVRGRPRGSADASPRARTYSGQRRTTGWDLAEFVQVKAIFRCR
jgi:hypothetical protein